MVITATSAPDPVVRSEDLAELLPQRAGRQLVLVDISLPRNVEEAVDHLPGVVRYDLDDLRSVVDETLAHRQAAVPRVEQIIAEETDDLVGWLNSRQVVPVIVEMRRKAELIALDEVTAALERLPHLDAKRQQVVARLAHRLVNKLLHEPTVRLKDRAAAGDGEAYAQAIGELFALGGQTADSRIL